MKHPLCSDLLTNLATNHRLFLNKIPRLDVTSYKKHKFLFRSIKVLVPESNEAMRDSYLILDEYMRFLDNTGGEKRPSKSILDVGVNQALKFSGFDKEMFRKRGGKYQWSKDRQQLLDW